MTKRVTHSLVDSLPWPRVESSGRRIDDSPRALSVLIAIIVVMTVVLLIFHSVPVLNENSPHLDLITPIRMRSECTKNLWEENRAVNFKQDDEEEPVDTDVDRRKSLLIVWKKKAANPRCAITNGMEYQNREIDQCLPPSPLWQLTPNPLLCSPVTFFWGCRLGFHHRVFFVTFHYNPRPCPRLWIESNLLTIAMTAAKGSLI